MEPITTALGVAGSIGGLIDIISRSIFALSDLRGRYADCDFKIVQITGQLSTFRAALKKIKDFIEISHDDILRKSETHVFALKDQQLMQDLENSIESCGILIQRIDEKLSRFQPDSPSQSSGLGNLRAKLNFLLKESGIDEDQDSLSRHVIALNLLLTAARCESSTERADLLLKESSRSVFERIKDDTSSLLLQRDGNSLLSRQSSAIDDSNLNDIEFGFDGELFSSKPYLSAARSWMCQAIMSRKKQRSSTTLTAAALSVNENDSVISDTSTLVVVNDDQSEVITLHSVAVPYPDTTPLPAIPEQPSKTREKRDTNKKKTTFKMPEISNMQLGPPRSPRIMLARQFIRRVAPPQSAYHNVDD